MKLLRSALAVIALALLAACGTKGPLYIPQQPSAAPAGERMADDSSAVGAGRLS